MERDHGMQRLPKRALDDSIVQVLVAQIKADPKDDNLRLALADRLELLGEKAEAFNQRSWASGLMDCIYFIDPANGEVRAICPTGANVLEGESYEFYMARMATDMIATYPDVYASGQYWVVPKEDVPMDRFFQLPDAPTTEENRVLVRHCLSIKPKPDGKTADVDFDVPTVKSEYMRVLRVERDRRLKDSDAEFARASDVGTPQELAKVKQHRQKLRDLPAEVSVALEAAATVEDIKNVVPAWPTRD